MPVQVEELFTEFGGKYLLYLGTVATACAFSHVGNDLRSFISFLAQSFIY